jgi:hypothetical protein
MEVLDRIEQALKESLARAEPPQSRPETPGEATQAVKQALDQLAERQGRLQTVLDRAGEDASRAETALTVEVEDLERWMREGCAVRERVATQARGAV